ALDSLDHRRLLRDRAGGNALAAGEAEGGGVDLTGTGGARGERGPGVAERAAHRRVLEARCPVGIVHRAARAQRSLGGALPLLPQRPALLVGGGAEDGERAETRVGEWAVVRQLGDLGERAQRAGGAVEATADGARRLGEERGSIGPDEEIGELAHRVQGERIGGARPLERAAGGGGGRPGVAGAAGGGGGGPGRGGA